MIYMPNVLLIGSSTRNSGKTTFAAKFVQKWGADFNIIAFKISTVRDEGTACHHGAEGCGECEVFSGPYEMSEETCVSARKDTSLLLKAGAKRVFRVRVARGKISEAFEEMKGYISSADLVVCESNQLGAIIKPGVAVMMDRANMTDIKDSAQAFLDRADFLCDISLDIQIGEDAVESDILKTDAVESNYPENKKSTKKISVDELLNKISVTHDELGNVVIGL